MTQKEMIGLLDQVLTVLHSHTENGGVSTDRIVIEPTTGELTLHLR
jgi:hypothetical protein